MTDLHPKRLSLAALPSEELRTLLRESGDPDVLLAAAELLQERGDAAFLPPDTEAALRRFRRDFLPTTKLDPDARETAGTSRLWRILPLAAIIVTLFAVLAYAVQMQRAPRSTATIISRRETSTAVTCPETQDGVPSFSIELPKNFCLEDPVSDAASRAVVYRDSLDRSRYISLTFTGGQEVSFAPAEEDLPFTREVTVPGYDFPCILIDRGDSVVLVVTHIGRTLIQTVIETNALTSEETVALAESLHILEAQP